MGPERDQRDTQRDRGVALVEFAFVALMLFALIFGIISYAYMMSFRGALSQSAAEGARAAAVRPVTDPDSTRLTEARLAVTRSLDRYGVSCSGTGDLVLSSVDVGTCSVTIAACPAPSTNRCATVLVSFLYRANPLITNFPGLGMTLPNELRFTSVAEVS